MRGLPVRSVAILLVVSMAAGCLSKRRLGRPSDSCSDDADCEGGICWANQCLDPDRDEDGDGLRNGEEAHLARTNPLERDTDGDGVDDKTEIGDLANPSDADGDGRNDANESKVLDGDKDCLPDQFDPHNDVPDPNQGAKLVQLFCDRRDKGVCAQAVSQIVATCEADATTKCAYDAVPRYEAVEVTCDGDDNDCDGQSDKGALVPPPTFACLAAGVCGEVGAPVEKRCTDGHWSCDYTAVAGWEDEETLCDGRDNDCDGTTDDDLEDQPCKRKNDFGECDGKTVCAAAGTVECSGPDAEPEVCDGADNDCDGGTDEDDACLKTARITGKVHHFGARPEIEGATAAAWDIASCEAMMAGKTPAGQPAGTAKSNASGDFDLPVKPGDWCVRVEAGGFQPSTSWSFEVGEHQEFALDFALTPVESDLYGVSVCGLTVDSGTGLPVAGVNVAMHSVGGDEVAATTSDDAGRYCLPSVAAATLGGPDAISFKLSAVRQDYRLLTIPPIQIAKNVVPIFVLPLVPLPTEITTCFSDSFEPCEGAACPQWSPDKPTNGVGWTRLFSEGFWTGVNTAVGTCVQPSKDEQCEPAAAGCAVCESNAVSPACVPEKGGLPLPYTGQYHYWFGNHEFGNYLGFDGKCSQQAMDGGKASRVTGSLTSPLIDATGAVNLELSFRTTWEVEGFHPDWYDQMSIEVQVEGSEGWTHVVSLNSGATANEEDLSVAWSSAGLGLSPTWGLVGVDLSGWVGSKLRVRFRFDSVDGDCNAFRGWFVDDVEVTGAGCKPFAPPAK
ncbi:MAG: hypothetical protein FJ087_12085 [Deltaproteobacteria bacterium]|nr:hypothetical protein [Deltaproteobacteria bacterium]